MILYKYCSFERVDILKNCCLRCSPTSVLNDIFESFPLYPGLIEDSHLHVWDSNVKENYYELKTSGATNLTLDEYLKSVKKFKNNANKKLKKDSQFACMCTWAGLPVAADMFTGIISLSQTPKDLLMWSHYASENRGFVIGFNVDGDWLSNTESTLYNKPKKIKYSKLRPKNQQHNLFYKSENWKYEREWRILLQRSECFRINNDPWLFVKDFKAESVVSIILGSRMKKSIRMEIFNLKNKFPNANLFRSFPNLNKFTMDVVPFDKAHHLPYFDEWQDRRYDMSS